MVELQILSKIIESGSLEILSRNGITADFFLVEREKIDFIIEHYNTYGRVPDKVTYLAEFEDAELFTENESESYLIDKLKEAKAFALAVPMIKEASEKVRENSFEGINFLKQRIEEILRGFAKHTKGEDIIKTANKRLTEYERRASMHGLLGIPTGIEQFDAALFGWLPEDLVLIYGRTNEGKSWVVLYFNVIAWAAGRKVLFYSGEMSPYLVGFRFDNLYRNFNINGLMGGLQELGSVENTEIGSRNAADYRRYVTELAQKDGFIVCTQKDFGGNKPTVSQLKQLMIDTGADLLSVDQLSLMTDERKGKDKRERFTNITEDLFLLSEAMQKPVLAVGQASREAVKSRKKAEDTPELHEISESDGVGQNATRAISLRVVNKVLRLSVKKNRYGRNNFDVLLMWDVELGILKPLLQTSGEETATEFGF